MLSEARTVIALAPDLVDEVKKGQRSLADAYQDGAALEVERAVVMLPLRGC